MSANTSLYRSIYKTDQERFPELSAEMFCGSGLLPSDKTLLNNLKNISKGLGSYFYLNYGSREFD